MRALKLLIASTIVLAGCAQEPEVTTREFDTELKAILADYRLVSVSAIDLDLFYDWNGEGSLPIHGSVVLAGEEPAELASHLFEFAKPHDGSVTLCFDPRHAINFEKGDSTFSIAICFKCDNFALYGDAPEGKWSEQLKGFSDDLRAHLDPLLNTAGVAITPSG